MVFIIIITFYTVVFQEGRTAVHLAAEHGHQEVLDLLLDYNANPNSETIVSAHLPPLP